MKKTYLLACFFLASASILTAQQLYFEGFTGRNRTNYDLAPYKGSPQWYMPVGGRFAFGADNVQIGAEYQQNLANPNFSEKDAMDNKVGETEFETTYYGVFLRGKFSRYPTTRFGLVLRAGTGLYNTTRNSTAPLLAKNVEYEQKLGFNGGIGVSIPIMRPIMFELSYNYHTVEYDAIIGKIGAMNGGFHSIQAGISFNFVFGKRAEAYQHLEENWRFRNGWRG